MKAYIVRHTSVLWDGNETCYGETDIDVRPTFAEEAEVTLRALRGLSFDAVFSSPLQRARKLASYCGHPEALLDDRLKEMNFGLWEGRPWAEIIRDEPVDEFFARYIEHPTPEGESLVMQYSRVEDFLREKRREGRWCDQLRSGSGWYYTSGRRLRYPPRLRLGHRAGLLQTLTPRYLFTP